MKSKFLLFIALAIGGCDESKSINLVTCEKLCAEKESRVVYASNKECWCAFSKPEVDVVIKK